SRPLAGREGAKGGEGFGWSVVSPALGAAGVAFDMAASVWGLIAPSPLERRLRACVGVRAVGLMAPGRALVWHRGRAVIDAARAENGRAVSRALRAHEVFCREAQAGRRLQ